MLRDVSEAVGLISLRCLHAVSTNVIKDTPDIASVMKRALTRLRATPFMEFDTAIEIADEIDIAASNGATLPGYNELVRCLLEENDQND
jgi:hypothetical protein